MNRRLIALIIAFAFVGTAALRADEEMEKGKGPCKADVEKFCKSVKPGQGRVIKCLKQHESELSPECKAKGQEMKDKNKDKNKEKREDRKEKREEMKNKMETFQKACKNDVKTLCSGVPQGEGRIIKCLKEKASQASPACQAELAKMPAK